MNLQSLFFFRHFLSSCLVLAQIWQEFLALVPGPVPEGGWNKFPDKNSSREGISYFSAGAEGEYLSLFIWGKSKIFIAYFFCEGVYSPLVFQCQEPPQQSFGNALDGWWLMVSTRAVWHLEDSPWRPPSRVDTWKTVSRQVAILVQWSRTRMIMTQFLGGKRLSP